MSDARPRAGDSADPPTVAVVGGGLAGLAAAARLAEAGMPVELFESRSRLGGRAGSIRDPRLGWWFDACQHVAMGCCTCWLDFCRRTQLLDAFRRDRRVHFFGPNGRRYDLTAAPGLPAPLHLLPSLMRLGYLSLDQRRHVVAGLMRLARHVPDGSAESIESWLARHGQSAEVRSGFWSVVLQSALSEQLSEIDLAVARKVFVDGFMATRDGYELFVPRYPLAKIYDERLGRWLANRGVVIHRGRAVARIEGSGGGVDALRLADGRRVGVDFVVAAVAWRQIRKLFEGELGEVLSNVGAIDNLCPAPITAAHLWFDRPVTELPHAALVGRLTQWVFRHGAKPDPAYSARGGSPPCQASILHPQNYLQAVVSGERALLGQPKAQTVARVLDDLRTVWPEADRAKLLQWRLVTQPAAVFSPGCGTEARRPSQTTEIPNLFLAGDWTQTGWPSTMEGAVRSGYLAAGAIGGAAGATIAGIPEEPRAGLLARMLLPSG